VHQTHVPVQVRQQRPDGRAVGQHTALHMAGARCSVPTRPSSRRSAVRCLSGRAIA